MARQDIAPDEALDVLREFFERAQKAQAAIDNILAAHSGEVFRRRPRRKVLSKPQRVLSRPQKVVGKPVGMKDVLKALVIEPLDAGRIAETLGDNSPEQRQKVSTHLSRAKRQGWVKHRKGRKGNAGKWTLTTQGDAYLNA